MTYFPRTTNRGSR